MKDIPKIIWQTHEVSYNDLDNVYKKNISIWLTKNIEWQHRYFNAEERKNFLINNGFLKSDLALKHYDNLHPINQADLWRVAVVWLNGGAWVDIDSRPSEDNTLNKAIEKAGETKIDYTIICTYDPNHLHIGCNNAHFIGVKGSNFLKYLLDKWTSALHADWKAIEYSKKFQRLEFVLNSGEFGRSTIYRDDVAYTFPPVLHGDEYKPKNEKRIPEKGW